MIKTIGFDFDGVISDSLQNEFEIRKSILLADGKSFPYSTAAELRQSIGLAIPEQWAKHGYDWENDKKHLYEVYEKARSIFKSGLVPGIEEAIRALVKRDLELCVISNTKERELREGLQRLGIEDLFKEIIGPSETLRTKPEPDMIYEALKRFNCSADMFAYVGDSPIDMIAGNRAGVITIAAYFPKSAWATEDALIAANSNHLVRSPAELVDLL